MPVMSYPVKCFEFLIDSFLIWTMLTHRHVEVFRDDRRQRDPPASCCARTATVSRELARMEHSIGFPLFERIRGRLRPTMRALALYDEVRQSYAGLERVASAAARCAPIRTASWR